MEIVFRAAFMFLILWLVTRAAGCSTLGELCSFQLLLFVTMGDLPQKAVTQQGYSVTSGVLAISPFGGPAAAPDERRQLPEGHRPSRRAGRPVAVDAEGEQVCEAEARSGGRQGRLPVRFEAQVAGRVGA
jgi:hypothetical protein